MTRRPDRASQAGTTLIELLVTIAIMGIAFVGVVGGIGTAIIGADFQKRGATSGIVLTSAAERIAAETTPYVRCATPDKYQDPSVETSEYGIGIEVLYWDGGSRFGTSCTVAEDRGVQLIRLTLTPPPGPRANEVETLDVVKLERQLKREPAAP